MFWDGIENGQEQTYVKKRIHTDSSNNNNMISDEDLLEPLPSDEDEEVRKHNHYKK